MTKRSPSPPAAALGQAETQLLREIVALVTDSPIEKIEPATKLVGDLLLDSVLRVELVAQIEEKLARSVSETVIRAETTVGELEAAVAAAPAVKPRPKLRSWTRSGWARWPRLLMQWVFLAPYRFMNMRVTVRGADHLANLALPAIFMPNHVHTSDAAAVLAALPKPIRRRVAFAAAQDALYEKWRWVAPLTELGMNTFPFPRREQDNIRHGLDAMGRLLDNKWSVIVYPEGQASYSENMLPLKRGAGLIGVTMGVPVVPVRVTGLSSAIRPMSMFFRHRAQVTVTFGEPLTFAPEESHITATERLTKAFQAIDAGR